MATTRYYKYETVVEGIRRRPVGCFNVLMEVGDPRGARFEPLEALVDTGTFYTMVPASILQELGVVPSDRRSFELADDRVVEYDMGETLLRLAGRTMFTLVVFGEGNKPLLGAYTLEGFGLAVDPVNQRLTRMPPVPGR